MLDKFKQLLMSSGSRGPRPSGICLWHDLQGLNELANELAAEATTIPDWATLKQRLAANKGQD